ncbi:MAG: DUF2974 domain-containing protein [Clostridia bacterium]|nr:DUF2974 domain-containing protein [Clostridia bacterium]
MADVYEYLRWRGDVPFVGDPFGEVDAMILSMLAYVELDGIVEDGGKEKTLREVYDGYFRDRTPDDVREDKDLQPKSPLLLDGMLSGGRFGDMTFSFYDDETVAERDMQFCAVTYRLSDGTAFVAFRGIDSTLTGWREDFDLSFRSRTEGQLKAASYLDRVGKALRVPLRVGGHSKGGNLAVFASAFCSSSVRRRIKAVYSFDGPGFPRETVETEEYRAVLGKTVSFIPDTSLIGQLLISEAPREVVKSTAKGIGQHDALTWSIERNRFEKTELSTAGEMIGRAVGEWIEKIDYDTRKSFTETVFSLFASTGADTFSEIGKKKGKSAGAIFSAMKGLPRDKQRELIRLIAMLGQSGGAVATDYINKKIEKKQDKETD